MSRLNILHVLSNAQIRLVISILIENIVVQSAYLENTLIAAMKMFASSSASSVWEAPPCVY